jgi:hypothetical protein
MAPSGAVGLAFVMSLWLKPMLQALPPMLDRVADRW